MERGELMIHVYLSLVPGMILKEQFTHFYVDRNPEEVYSKYCSSPTVVFLGYSYNMQEEKWGGPSDVTKTPS